eukprot:15466669-Alexandrium_andersonii.AAC.1
MVDNVWSTLTLENSFNDLRDNEQRAARHKSRSAERLQAVEIASLEKRLAEHRPIVQLAAEDFSRFKDYHCRPGTFQASQAPGTEEACGFRASEILADRRTWASTSVDQLGEHALPLGHALLRAPEVDWPRLWMARLLPSASLVVERLSGKAFLVARVTHWTWDALEVEGGGDVRRVTADPDKVHAFQTLAALDALDVCDFSISLSPGGGLNGFFLHL